MARKKEIVEADLDWCFKAIEMASPFDKNWDWLIRRRNELSIELRLAKKPVHKQRRKIQEIYLSGLMSR